LVLAQAAPAAHASVGSIDEYAPPGGGSPGGTPGGTPGGGGPLETNPGGSYTGTPGIAPAQRPAGPSAGGLHAGTLPFTGYPLNPLILILLLLLLLAMVIRLYVAARERARRPASSGRP